MSAITGLHAHNFNTESNPSSDSNSEIIALWKTGAMHYRKAGDAPLNQWFKGPGLTITQTNYGIYMDSFLDQVFLVDGVDPLWNYNGSIWTTTNNVVNAPIAKFVKSFGPRLYLFDINISGTRYGSRVWLSEPPKNNVVEWSLETGSDLSQTAGSQVVVSVSSSFKTRGIKIGDPFLITSGTNAGEYTVSSLGDANGDNPETNLTLTEELSNTVSGSTFWVGGNWFDVGLGDGDMAKGIGRTANELFFFKQRSVYRYNTAAESLIKLSNTPGTSAPPLHCRIPGLRLLVCQGRDLPL